MCSTSRTLLVRSESLSRVLAASRLSDSSFESSTEISERSFRQVVREVVVVEKESAEVWRARVRFSRVSAVSLEVERLVERVERWDWREEVD